MMRRAQKRLVFQTELGQELLEYPDIRDNVAAWDVALERIKVNVRKYLEGQS